MFSVRSYSILYLLVGCIWGSPVFSDLVIEKVVIKTEPVFIGKDLHAVQKIANQIHIDTKEHVISNELLFAHGDMLDEELLEESERNLRQFDFLGQVEVLAKTNLNDTVDITVATQDQWSLIPALILNSAGGLTRFGGSIEEYNFLGRGKYLYLDAVYESDVGTTYSLGYYDPRLWGSDHDFDIDLRYGPLIESVILSAGLPFKSQDSKWSYGSDITYIDRIDRLFNEGEEFSRLGVKEYGGQVDGIYAWGQRYARKKIKLAYEYTDKSYRELGDETTTPLPEDQLTATLKTKFTIKKERYVKEKQVDNFDKTEDYAMGRSTSVGIGRAGFPIPIGESRWEYVFDHYHGFQLTEDQYLFAEVDFTSQSVQNTILELESKYYWQWFDWQTIAFNIEFIQGWDLQSNKQFVLGAESGLRGYPAREFNGDKRFLVNLESRQFWARQYFTVDLGTVVFLDLGNAWQRNESIDFNDLNYCAGFGFRFGQSKLPGSMVIRLDFGWPIHNEADDMQVTLGIGQYFHAP